MILIITALCTLALCTLLCTLVTHTILVFIYQTATIPQNVVIR
ncbi:MAG: hypothetical protein RL344_1432 [Pseudomonadota bacterium]|jgi:hypothetical protein